MRLLSVLFLSFVGTLASAQNFTCAETASEAVRQGRRQYGVTVVRLAEVKDPKVVGDYDGAELVQVSVLSRDPRAARSAFQNTRSFRALAKFEDVMYFVRSRQNGFSLNVYLDEMDQTTMKLSWVKGDIRMKCSGR